ncbi:hypothetical protein GW17_00052143 [Ensete ventricosum]|nr:hypothetical protein GW17_00052143 [Ensete ventricosum]RZS00154.1 hypothetical protein BHM03_00029803 [Ensete ventricosum]
MAAPKRSYSEERVLDGIRLLQSRRGGGNYSIGGYRGGNYNLNHHRFVSYEKNPQVATIAAMGYNVESLLDGVCLLQSEEKEVIIVEEEIGEGTAVIVIINLSICEMYV